jgi:hypothetical protein
LLTSLLEMALGPMLSILFGTSAVATAVAILVAVRKKGWALALTGVAMPFFVACAGAALALLELHFSIKAEGSGLTVVAPPVLRALMLSMLGFAATLAPAIPAIMGAPKDVLSRWPFLPLLVIPVLAIAQVPFGYPATALIRLVPYIGIAGALGKRDASPALLLPVVAAGEMAAVAVAYVDLLSSLAMASIGMDVVAGSARDIAAARWFGVASIGMVVLSLAIAKKWLPLILLAPLCVGAVYLADATISVLTWVK